MVYRRGWVPVLYRSELEKRLKEHGFENWEEITRFLCGRDNYVDPDGFDYQVVDQTVWRKKRDATFLQRINRLWFIPLWVLTMPFQWLFRGRTGFSTTSKIGKLCQRITGLE